MRELYALYSEVVTAFEKARGVYQDGCSERLCWNLVAALHANNYWCHRNAAGEVEAFAVWWTTDLDGFARAIESGRFDREIAEGDFLFVADFFNAGPASNIALLKDFLDKYQASRDIKRVGWRSHGRRAKLFNVEDRHGRKQ